MFLGSIIYLKNMGRRVNFIRKRNELKIRNFSPCQWNYLKDIAAMESHKRNRVVGLSEMTAKIIFENMQREGYLCGT